MTSSDKESFLRIRKGETHIGERIRCCDELGGDALHHPGIQFVLVGLPEDIGVRANNGIGGAQTSWKPFLKTFLNIQETDFLSGDKILLYGCLLQDANVLEEKENSIGVLREETARLDDLIFPIIERIVAAGKIPIIIGGGHNNAFPNLKGSHLAKGTPVNAINIDAHADFRTFEGRHSGNGFSYAFMKGHLKKYFALGLHEAYNSREMMQNMQESENIEYIYWEDIFMRQFTSWNDAIEKSIQHVSSDFFGVEMDVDCIEGVLSSAATPLGIQPREAIKALYQCGKNPNAIYLHIPEAISERQDGIQNPFTGKLLSYLVQAFAKGVSERK